MSKRCCAPNLPGGLASLLRAAAFAIAFIACMAPAEAGPVAGANTCGGYVNRTPSTISASSMSDLREAMICLINAERTTRQLPALTLNSTLYNSAQSHADAAQQLKWWTNGTDPHVNPETGSTIDSRIKAAGYCSGNPNRTGEIAYTWARDQATPVGAVNWWMNISTSGHREVNPRCFHQRNRRWHRWSGSGQEPSAAGRYGNLRREFRRVREWGPGPAGRRVSGGHQSPH